MIHRPPKSLKAKGLDLKIEVETQTLDEVGERLRVGGIHRILLENMSADLIQGAVALVGGKYETEASGNIVMENLCEKALSGVDYLSMDALTHSVSSLDISLKAVK